MRSIEFIKRVGILFCVAVLLVSNLKSIIAQTTSDVAKDSYAANNRPPDPRFKADILVVVAHPDDETMVTAYLARAIYEQHKRVAVVYGTRGDGGNNDVGPEQALAMGQMREIEAREANASLGISNVWFLNGRDTPSQNVLNSLENWGHGAALEQLVRIVRLTRPTVILTFLPDFTTGENHSDHQASGVLATEAFDLAGNPAVFPEQTSPVTNPDGNMNLTEGLRTWQPQKIYYFYNPSYDFFAGRGPQYSSSEISPSQHLSYGLLAAKVYAHHSTQGGDRVQRAIDLNLLGTSDEEGAQLTKDPVKLIFGKSLVPSGITDDIFVGIVPDGIPFHRVLIAPKVPKSEPVLTVGDPWNFYHNFWRDHGLDLAAIVPLEITIKVGGTLILPLIIDNPLDKPINVDLAVQSPEGWRTPLVGAVTVAPHSQYFLRVQSNAPPTKLTGWQNFVVTAQSDHKNIGTVSMRVELSTGWVAPQ